MRDGQITVDEMRGSAETWFSRERMRSRLQSSVAEVQFQRCEVLVIGGIRFFFVFPGAELVFDVFRRIEEQISFLDRIRLGFGAAFRFALVVFGATARMPVQSPARC